MLFFLMEKRERGRCKTYQTLLVDVLVIYNFKKLSKQATEGVIAVLSNEP